MSLKNEVLYISYDGMTDPLGQGQVLSYLECLSKEGFSISLISFEKAGRFEEGKKNIYTICGQAGIHWHPLIYTKRPPVISTLYDVYRMWKAAKKIHSKKKFLIVHCRSYISALVGLRMKKKFATAFIFDMRGFWIDEKIEAGDWNIAKPVYRKVINYFRKKENEFYHSSDIIVTLTKAAKNAIIKSKPELADKISIIPTCVNLDVFKPFQANIRKAIRKKLGIPENAFVLLYSGGYGPNYNIHFLLQVFSKLKETNPETCLLVLSKDGVTGLETKNNMKNIFSATLPYTLVSDYLMAGDLGVINYADRFSVAGRSPTKLGEYWASGLPAVAPKGIGDVDQLFAIYKNGGIIYSDEDFNGRLKDVIDTDKNVLRSYAEDYFSLKKGIQLYKNVYTKLPVKK
jgi:glycosyltransferase involved in cell wall biosynthesis